MARRTKEKMLAIIVIVLVVVSTGCTQTHDIAQKTHNIAQKTYDMAQRALGRDIMAQRVSETDAWCPKITTFKVSPLTVQCGDPVTLELGATVPHTEQFAEQLSYTWEIEGQTFETGRRAVWNTPSAPMLGNPEKVYSVRGVVSDGECAVVRSVEVKVQCNSAFDLMIHFAFGKADLDATAKSQLDQFGKKLQQYPEHFVLIEGHTDYIGSDQYNQQLGRRRAETVKEYLVNTWKIDPDRLITRSLGEKVPIAPNETPTGRAKNRRAEIFRVILKTK